MCTHIRRTPNKLQLLAFRQLAQNVSCEELEYINEISVLRKYFSQFNFVVTSDYHIVKKGYHKSTGFIVRGSELANYIKNKLSCREFTVNFWCNKCLSYCSQCFDLYSSIEHINSTHKENCKTLEQ